MTEQQFLKANSRFKKRQAAEKEHHKQVDPQRIGEILPEVLSKIQRKAVSHV